MIGNRLSYVADFYLFLWNLGMDKFKGMQVFVTCLEKGSFSAAAAVLGTSPQNIAKTISSLEKEIGVRLINRNTRSQSPTEVGRIYFDRCRRILEDLEESEQFLEKYQNHLVGRLRIAVPSTFGIYVLSRKLPTWLRSNENVAIDICVTDSYPEIIEGGFDLALAQGEMPASSLICKKMADIKIQVAASDFYLRYSDPIKSPYDLINHKCIRRPDQNIWNFLDFEGKEIDISVSDKYVSDNCQVSCEMAVDGLGVTKQPAFRLKPFFDRGLLRPVLTDFKIPDKPLYLLYPDRKSKSAKLASFIKFIESCFNDYPAEYFSRR